MSVTRGQQPTSEVVTDAIGRAIHDAACVRPPTADDFRPDPAVSLLDYDAALLVISWLAERLSRELRCTSGDVFRVLPSILAGQPPALVPVTSVS